MTDMTHPSQITYNAIRKFKDTIRSSSSPFRHYLGNGTILTPGDRDIFRAAVNAAYNDAARTFTHINGNSDNAKNTLAEEIRAYFKDRMPCQSADEFDELHNSLCNIFLASLSQSGYNDATYGQAQKVVNMTFKYLYCLDNAITDYNDYFEYCHVALDSFTLEWIWRNCDPGRLNKYEAWSNLKKGDYRDVKGDYKDSRGVDRPGYDRIVELYRNKIPSQFYLGCTPFHAEFIFWPEIKLHLAAEAFYFALNDNLTDTDREDFKRQSIGTKKNTIKAFI